MHMLEDHIVPFIRKWQVGCGFYGEQGGESLHQAFNRMKDRYTSIKDPVERVRYMMKQHYLTAFPETDTLLPKVKRRKMHKEE